MTDQPDHPPAAPSLETATAAAWSAYEARDWPEALRRWEAVQDRWPHYAPGHVHAAASLWESGQHEAAVAALRRASIRVPADAQVITRLGEALARLGRHADAGQVLGDAVPRFPYNPEIAIDYLRLAHEAGDSEAVLRRGALVAETHPALLAQDAGVFLFLAEARRALGHQDADLPGIWGAAALYDPKRLMLSFESLGENCEFGLVQRHFGVEPLGLLRWTATSAYSLTTALDETFDGVGTRECTLLIESGAEYATAHRRYGMGSHTDTKVDPSRRNDIYDDQIRRLSFLRGKLIEDLEENGKIFVYHCETPIQDSELRSIHRAMCRYGARHLLHVRVSDAGNPPGSVQDLGRGLMVAHLGRLGPRRAADGDHWDELAFDQWLTVCRMSRMIRARQDR